jgi:hypothetical protein
MSSFSDINNNKSIKSSLHVGGNNPMFGCGSTQLSSQFNNNGGIALSNNGAVGIHVGSEERKKSQFFKK